MPELPEVETVAQDLRPLVRGRRVERVEVRMPGVVRYPDDETFAAFLRGRRFGELARRGKYLLLPLEARPETRREMGRPGGADARRRREAQGVRLFPRDRASQAATPQMCRMGVPDPSGLSVALPDGETPGPSPLLVCHLGMTGQLRLVPPGTPEPDHLHVVLHLDGGDELRYRDPRRFGRLLLGTPDDLIEAGAMPLLGPEPIAEDFTGALLWHRLHHRRAPIKALLLEQTMVAGVGNIYADEALFRSRIRPLRPANSLSRPAVRRLAVALREVLLEAIQNRGSSVVNYRDVWGQTGSQQNRLLVYGRAGEPCVRCGRPLRLSRIAQRSAVWCGWCQR